MAKVSTGDVFLSINCASLSGQRRAGAFTPSLIKGFDVDVVSTFCDKGKKMYDVGVEIKIRSTN